MGDIQTFRAWAATLPHTAFLIVLLAWTANAFCGSFITACQPYGRRMILACLVGAVFWLATLFNLIAIPGPIYMWLGLAIVPLVTIAGARLTMKLNPHNPPGPRPYDMRKKEIACK